MWWRDIGGGGSNIKSDEGIPLLGGKKDCREDGSAYGVRCTVYVEW